jgi:long-chain acyl-CoA synthetase
MEVKLEEYKIDLLNYINTKVNKFSNVKKINIQKDPFEKTPTQKIKRYKYNSND